jgi:hypothetical protein
MLERDEYGYVLKIVSNFPYHPWWRLTSQLVEGFRDKKKTGLVSSVGVYSPKFGLGSFENPKMIGRGEVDAGIINPPVTAKMAMEGRGPYKERVGELRAIARFPEPDYFLACRCRVGDQFFRGFGKAKAGDDPGVRQERPHRSRHAHLDGGASNETVRL